MVILFFGDNEFESKRKLKKALENYKKKHKTGLNLLFFYPENFSFEKFKDATETAPMFFEKKCLVLKDFFSKKHKDTDVITKYIKDNRLKENSEVVIIFFESHFDDKKDKNFFWLCQKPSLPYQSKSFNFQETKRWVRKEALSFGFDIENEAIESIILYCGQNLFKIENELIKFQLLQKKKVAESDIKNLVFKGEQESNIFEAVECLAKDQKQKALEIFFEQIKEGKTLSYILTMISFQFRNILKVKSLLEAGVLSDSSIAKQAKLHPFVVKKTIPLAKKTKKEDIARIFKKAQEAEKKSKTSQIDDFLLLLNLIFSK